MQLAAVGLQQHLGDRGGSAEVAVDLKRRMGIEEVVERRFGQQQLEIFIRFFGVLEPGPEVDQPSAAPAGVAAAVRQAMLDGFAAGGGELGRPPQGELLAGVQAERMRDMAVAGVGFRELLGPLHQPAVAADLGAGQSAEFFPHLCRETVFDAQFTRRRKGRW